ncbi:MAG: acyl-CoA dehydrogenase family protein, partial [Planctomycetes bacterium]|nr:acyl-CoA dehydrogenase family protein [Planctomycetota bacterium]
MHNLQLTEDQALIVDTVRKFTADVVAPTVLDHDEHRRFARAEFDGLAELGMFGLLTAEDNGGAGMGMVPLVAALESIGEQSGSLARLFLTQVQCALALEAAGSELLEGVMAGGALAVFLGFEHGFVVEDGALSGMAELVPGGGEANVFVVAATENDEPVLVTCDAAATPRTALRSLGMASTAPARVRCAGSVAAVVARGEKARPAIAAAHRVAMIGVAAAAA